MKSTDFRSLSITLTGWLLSFSVISAVVLLPASAIAQQARHGDATALEAGDIEQSADDANGLGGITRDGDNFKSPKAAERFNRRQEALRQRIAGSKQTGKVHQVANGQYVELGLEKTDKIFVILVEYGNQTGTALPTAAGPAHNAIPQPNRATDNNTIWQADYNRAHYEDMYFNKMAEYYRTQSSGRYTVNGQVTEWVKVPFNGSRYGNNGMGDAGAWTLIADAVNIWTQDQLAAGKSLQEITDYLKTFDTWDRYDYNNNGIFDEPDGYIDHFQIVHSGAGEETGGGVLGADAIWSHRWQAWYNFAGVSGPSFNKDGGVEFGGGWGANPNGGTVGSANALVQGINSSSASAATVQNAHPATHTGIFVGDYTIQPENGGLGVFAHEFGHDLGLPDHYDTAGGDNSTGFWTIMSSGSYLGNGTTDIGARPGDFYAWDKLQLGWLNYTTVNPGQFASVKLGPAETNTKKSQAVVIPLDPTKNDLFLNSPTIPMQYGSKAWWGGKADKLDSSMVRSIAVPAGTSTLTMRLKYAIEANWDYAYVSVSTDGGTTWTNLAGTYLNTAGTQSALTTNSNPNGQNLGNGITGSTSNATNAPNGWRLASFNMTPYAGQTVQLRLRYKTDDYTTLNGIMADEITLGGFNDGAESGDNGWTLNGFKATTGKENVNAPHYYIAEYRQYRTYDEGLQTGPYVFGFVDRPSWVAHFPYQDGMLITYWDTDQANNNTSTHPGEGRSLPIDAHPEPLRRRGLVKGGTAWNFAPWSGRYQAYDSTFGLEPTDGLQLPFRGTLPGVINDTGCVPSGVNSLCQFNTEYPSLPGVPEFNDLNDYWFAETGASGVIVPKTGTTIRVINTSAQGSFMQIQVNAGQ